MPTNNNLVIGLTGSFGSGCGTVSDYLVKEKGFKSRSLTTVIKKEAAKRGLENPSREQLQDIGNELREKTKKPEYLAEEIRKTIGDEEKIVIKSIRNHHEVIFFKKTFPDFYLINIDAEKRERFKRNQTKYTNFTSFDDEDERDSGEREPEHGQHVSRCVDKADIVINNNENFEALYSNIDKYLERINNPGNYPPPQLTELHMAHAWQQSTLSECLKRKVGAVIAIKSHIIASGYNSPPGTTGRTCRNLDACFKDVAKSCEKCKAVIQIILPECTNCRTPTNKEQTKELNKNLDLCRSIHAEERAILQTAKIGGYNPGKSILYTTTFPCLLCAKKIVELGNIEEVVYIEPYPYRESYALMIGEGIKLTKFEGVKSSAFYRLYCKY